VFFVCGREEEGRNVVFNGSVWRGWVSGKTEYSLRFCLSPLLLMLSVIARELEQFFLLDSSEVNVNTLIRNYRRRRFFKASRTWTYVTKKLISDPLRVAIKIWRYICLRLTSAIRPIRTSGVQRGMGFGGFKPPSPKFRSFEQSWAEFPVPWKIQP
jgi:hypothetical protein